MLDSAEDLDRKRICRIVTRDFPQYFAVVSRVKQDSHLIGPEGGVLSSTVVPQVQAVFPEGALTKRIRVGLQVRGVGAAPGGGAAVGLRHADRRAGVDLLHEGRAAATAVPCWEPPRGWMRRKAVR